MLFPESASFQDAENFATIQKFHASQYNLDFIKPSSPHHLTGTTLTAKKQFNVLFLCSGNSARSILCEAMLNHLGNKRFKAFSAGSQPKYEVHPMALEILRKFGISTDELKSNSWDEFAEDLAPTMDIVVTVCANTVAEVCPVWPSSPVSAQWSMVDPAAVAGPSEAQKQAFEQTLRIARSAVSDLVSTVLDDPSPETLAARINAISLTPS